MYENFDYNIGCLQSSGKKIDYLINVYENTGKEAHKLERHEMRTLLFALYTNDFQVDWRHNEKPKVINRTLGVQDIISW